MEGRGGYAVLDFWEPMQAPDKSLILDPNEFYIRIQGSGPGADYAAEMVPFDPLVANSACTMPGSSIRPLSALAEARAVLRLIARSALCPRARPDRRPFTYEKMLANPKSYTVKASVRTTRRRAQALQAFQGLTKQILPRA
jgi:hypothetical protein